MSVPYFNVKDKDGNSTKLPTASFDSANYPYNISYEPELAAALGMNSEEQAVSINGYHALASVVASTCLIGDTFGVSASSYGIGGFIPRVTATAGIAASGGSTNAGDAPAGAGALTINVTGVGPNFVEQYGTCTLSGVTAQPLVVESAGATATGTWMGINAVEVETAGASGKNIGTIYVGGGAFTSGVPASQMMGVAAGAGLSQQGTFVVPAGKTLYLKDMTYSASAAGTIIIQYSTETGIVKQLKLITAGAASYNATQIKFNYGLKIPEKCRAEIIAYGAAGSIRVECTVNGYLKNNV